MVRLVPWWDGYELHVDGVGVTQCVERSEVDGVVRDFLESLEHDDARTASVMVWGPPE